MLLLLLTLTCRAEQQGKAQVSSACISPALFPPTRCEQASPLRHLTPTLSNQPGCWASNLSIIQTRQLRWELGVRLKVACRRKESSFPQDHSLRCFFSPCMAGLEGPHLGIRLAVGDAAALGLLRQAWNCLRRLLRSSNVLGRSF